MHRGMVGAVVLGMLGGCDRGAWWWGKFDNLDPGGIGAFHAAAGGATMPAVPNADEMLPVLQGCLIGRLYGSYGDLPASDPQWMWEWNGKLHSWDVESYLLLADPDWLADPAALLGLLEERIGWWYHSPVGMSVASDFDGIHLDVEPVQMEACKTATLDMAQCRVHHDELLALVIAVRNWLDNTNPSLKLYVDVHHWTDVIGAGGRVDWGPGLSTNPADNRNVWYDTLADHVDGISVMAYSSNPVTLLSRAAWEFANVPTEVRLGMDTDDYPSIAANGVDGMMDVAAEMEGDHDQVVDIHRFNDLVLNGGCF